MVRQILLWMANVTGAEVDLCRGRPGLMGGELARNCADMFTVRRIEQTLPDTLVFAREDQGKGGALLAVLDSFRFAPHHNRGFRYVLPWSKKTGMKQQDLQR